MGLFATLLRFFAGFVFRVGLIALPSLIALYAVVHDPAQTRQLLADSNIYDSVRGEVLAKSIEATGDFNGKQLLSNPDTQKIILDAFTPAVLQRASEQLISDTYRWLDGTTPSITSRVDLTSARDQLVQGLTTYAQGRLDSLPQCTVAQMRQLDATAESVLTAPCRPIGMNASQASNEFARQVQDSASFLQNPVITIDTGKSTVTTGDSVQVSRGLPDAYQLLTAALWVTATLTVLAALAYVFLASDRHRAQRTVALWLVGTGLLVAAGAAATEYLVRHQLSNISIGTTTQAFRESLQSLVRSITQQYNSRLLITASAYIMVGLIWWVVLRRMQGPVNRQLNPGGKP